MFGLFAQPGFADRTEAGCRLAEALQPFQDQQPVVLALPRGGVPVAYEVAKTLRAPLDLVLVRKIGAPFQPELAIGAVVDGERPELVVNRDVVDEYRIPASYLESERRRQLEEIERRRQLYLAGRPWRPPCWPRAAPIRGVWCWPRRWRPRTRSSACAPRSMRWSA
jgi:putative phosphoribosyl transferase